MKVLILGGGGVIGQKLGRKLAATGTLRGQPIAEICLADLGEPAAIDSAIPVQRRVCDIADRAQVDATITPDTDVIFLLAAVVSSHAEADFEAGLNANFFGFLNVVERCRSLGTNPVVVFSSSLAVFGGEVPDPIEDWTLLNPQTSYGTQKAIGELLLNDYSRRGYLRGRGFRLPTISVRPGKPNRAASSFLSSIVREPLNGETAICPVGTDFPHYFLSPRRCVENLIRGAELEQDALGQNCCMIMPGQRWTVAEMIEALTDIAGPEPAKLIRFEEQPDVEKIVMGWRYDFRPEKALALGLTADDDYRDNIRYYLEDDKP